MVQVKKILLASMLLLSVLSLSILLFTPAAFAIAFSPDEYPGDPLISENDASIIAEVENDFADEFRQNYYAGKMHVIERKVADVGGYHYYVANIFVTPEGYSKLSKTASQSIIPFIFKQDTRYDSTGVEWDYSFSGFNLNDSSITISWGKNVDGGWDSDNSKRNSNSLLDDTSNNKHNISSKEIKEKVCKYIADNVRDSVEITTVWCLKNAPGEQRVSGNENTTRRFDIDNDGTVRERVAGT